MANLQTQSTNGTPITVTYPALKVSGHRHTVFFRLGKKSVLPAYTEANLPHLVQFEVGQRIITFMLQDILEDSYWRRIRNAYDLRGQIDVAEDVKVGGDEPEKIIHWLRQESYARGIDPVAC